MPRIPDQDPLVWAIILTHFHFIAIGSTIWRLVHRRQIGRLWWDDYLAGVAVAVDVVFFTSLWIRYPPNERRLSQNAKVAAYYTSSISYFFTVWSGRMSLSLALARVFPPNTFWRRVAEVMTVLFALAPVSFTALVIRICEHETSWHGMEYVQCIRLPYTWLSTLLADFCSDIALTVCGILMLWKVKLPPSARSLIFSVLKASLLVGFVSIIKHIMVFGPPSWGYGKFFLIKMLCHLDAIVCVFVCNLMVMATISYRMLKGTFDTEDGVYSTDDTPDPRAVPDISRIIDLSTKRSTLVLTELGSSMWDDFLVGTSSSQSSSSTSSGDVEGIAAQATNVLHGTQSTVRMQASEQQDIGTTSTADSSSHRSIWRPPSWRSTLSRFSLRSILPSHGIIHLPDENETDVESSHVGSTMPSSSGSGIGSVPEQDLGELPMSYPAKGKGKAAEPDPETGVDESVDN